MMCLQLVFILDLISQCLSAKTSIIMILLSGRKEIKPHEVTPRLWVCSQWIWDPGQDWVYLGSWPREKCNKVFFSCIFGPNWCTKTHLDDYFHLAKTPAQSWTSLFWISVTHAEFCFCSSSFVPPKKLNWIYPEILDVSGDPLFASSCTGNVARHFHLQVKKCKMTGSYRSDAFNL